MKRKPKVGDTVEFKDKQGNIQRRVVESMLPGFVQWDNPNCPGTTAFASIEKVKVIKP